jgi:hypothetical protein
MVEHRISEEIFQKIYGFLIAYKKIRAKNQEKIRVFLEGVYFFVEQDVKSGFYQSNTAIVSPSAKNF